MGAINANCRADAVFHELAEGRCAHHCLGGVVNFHRENMCFYALRIAIQDEADDPAA